MLKGMFQVSTVDIFRIQQNLKKMLRINHYFTFEFPISSKFGIQSFIINRIVQLNFFLFPVILHYIFKY